MLLILVLLEGVEVHSLGALGAQLAEISGPAVRCLPIIVVVPDIRQILYGFHHIRLSRIFLYPDIRIRSDPVILPGFFPDPVFERYGSG